MQDGEVELLRVLQEREVTHIRQDQEAGVRDRCRDIFGVRAFDGFVMVAVDDKDGRVDRLELRVGPVRLFGPHLADLIDKRPVFLGRRRMRRIFVPGALDVACEGRVLLHALDDARGDGIGGKREHLADPVLVPHGEVDADDAAVAPADDVGFGDLQMVHQRNNVVSHQIVAVGACVTGAAAMAAAVHQNDGVVPRDDRYLLAPIVGVGEPAVEEDHRRAVAVDRVVDVDAIGMRLTASAGGERRRRRRQRLPPFGCDRRQGKEDE